VKTLKALLTLLCVQKIGNVMHVDRMPIVELSPGILLPIGDDISNQVLPRKDIEHSLNTTPWPRSKSPGLVATNANAAGTTKLISASTLLTQAFAAAA